MLAAVRGYYDGNQIVVSDAFAISSGRSVEEHQEEYYES